MDALVTAIAGGLTLVIACAVAAWAAGAYGPGWGLLYGAAVLVATFAVSAAVAGISDSIRRRRREP